MLRAATVIRHDQRAGRACADTVTLDREARFRRRIAMTSDGGVAFLLDLDAATYLAQGDALQLDDGRLIEVRAAAEELMEIAAPDARTLARIAWHIGNRHTPAEITGDAVYIQPDHVLAEMAAGLGYSVRRVTRPFEPEGGAYGSKGALVSGHHHGTDQDHRHDHGHDHGHDHAHGHHEHGHHAHGGVPPGTHRDHG
ncbi:urease accessory protein UreE [Blastochloris sulfoviridis]|uniref:Urease accessory protein UreE n=1 Tax=Blastochloris sulfoviridis TaxID=50712 RepID=A0A5M6I2F5_9HYPH|nr:urease accessory protein UreE [Blastochloris sulfoviridis]KAA5602396.1 urease accessory protein UreE [Blastochloris sulfoviridis]